jgi:hypothetical protein
VRVPHILEALGSLAAGGEEVVLLECPVVKAEYRGNPEVRLGAHCLLSVRARACSPTPRCLGPLRLVLFSSGHSVSVCLLPFLLPAWCTRHHPTPVPVCGFL